MESFLLSWGLKNVAFVRPFIPHYFLFTFIWLSFLFPFTGNHNFLVRFLFWGFLIYFYFSCPYFFTVEANKKGNKNN